MIDVTEMAEGARLNFQTFVTPVVWQSIRDLSDCNGIKPKENLRFVLHILNIAVFRRKDQRGEMIHFAIPTIDPQRRIRSLKLKAFIGCTPMGYPVFTVMMPSEEGGMNMTKERCGSLEECECFKKRCKHYSGMIQKNDQPGWIHICKAFPYGIPPEIWEGKDQHFKPLGDQRNNVVFEKAETYAGMELFRPKRGME